MARRRRRVREEVVADAPVRRMSEEVVEVPPPPRPPSSPWPWLLLLALLVVGGLIALLLWQNGVFDDEEPAQTVVVQTVTGDGETVVETTVTTTPADGDEPSQAAVPEVVGQGQVEAGEAIEALGLKADSYPVASAEAPGTVVGQDPAAGSNVANGSTVRLNVALGSGSRPGKEVPDVTGPKESDARASARANGFTVRTVDRDAPTPEEVGEVILQEPAAGATAPELTQITLYVGR